MSRPLVVPARTDEAQRRAGDPALSAWVSANAGSGKTFVLARRVIRLMLAGTDPARILCLTFTKAAAATMANRVYAILGDWATRDDARLAEEIEKIEGVRPSPERLARARRLFAAAIETPGGLKIQTIHGFCERILQQFPLEADLGGAFDILDPALETELVAAARDAVLVKAAAAPGTPLGRAFSDLVAGLGEANLLAGLDAVVAARDLWLAWIRRVDTLEAVRGDLAAALGVTPGLIEAALDAETLASPVVPEAYARRLIEAWRAGGKRDQDQAARLSTAIATTAASAERLEAWTATFLTKAGEAKSEGHIASKAVAAALPDVFERAAAEAERLKAIADRRAARLAFVRTAALLTLGDAVVGEYEARKRARGALDFDDLVGRTADLLSRSDAAEWVQYKLDRGIDHILVDEAQDTSPRQWRIVAGLTEEFFAGEGARGRARTVFAVGDEKQSIYSFQGAAPHAFSHTRRAYAKRVEDAGLAFADVKLDLSFRSTGDVLGAVDKVFARDDLARRLLADPADYVPHAAARAGAPGLVEIWPMVVAAPNEAEESWRDPIDRARTDDPVEILARRIADEIERLIGSGLRLEGTGEPVRPRDVIVLVRKRGPFVEAMNRVLKECGIAVAGQDRLRLTAHVAIADLLALGRALTLPEDDLSLAAVLKSPLFELDDDDLADLARADRRDGESLAEVLRRRAPGHPRFAEPAARLERWRVLAGRVAPYELFTAVLSTDGGRRRFAARLGSEAEDVLDEFMDLALGAEQGPPVGLTRFLEGVAIADPQIKRELDETRDEVRVMTVHGAKGLEAAVVFLVDPGSAPVHASHDPTLLTLEVPGAPPGAAPALVWNLKPQPKLVAARREAIRDEAVGEYWRLLYVAMTRAADRLYVCGHAPARGASPDGWHAAIDAALAADAEAVTDADGAVVARRWRAGPGTPLPPAPPKPVAPADEHPLPAWIAAPPPSVAAPRRLTPSAAAESEAETAAALAARDRSATGSGDRERRRGILIHRLLERLPERPPTERAGAAARFLAARAADFAEAERAALAAEVLAVLETPEVATVFSGRARAEVPVVGRLETRDGGTIEVAGRIDRLVIADDAVWIVDFKSDRSGGDGAAPAAYLRQMALYRRLLAPVFPGRRLRAFLLWTTRPALEELDVARLDAAVVDIAAS